MPLIAHMTMVAIVHLLIRLFLGVVLFSSGVSKLLHPGRFQQAIEDYEIIPSTFGTWLPRILSFAIPLLECAAGLGLVSGFFLVPVVILSMGLFAVFGGSLLTNLIQERTDLSCACGGILGNHNISWWLVVRNMVFIASLCILLL